MGLSFFLGSFFCSLLVDKLGIYKTCILGLIITLLGGIWMAIWYYQQGLTLHGFIYPMLLIGIGGTFCMSAGTGGSMIPFGENTGTAAALGVPAILFSLIGLIVFKKYLKE